MKTSPFANDCVRHENGYQTVANETFAYGRGDGWTPATGR